MEFSVMSRGGQQTGRTVVLDDEVFGIEPNEHAVYLDVKHYLAAQRQGTHKSKERAEVNYSTRKIKKQKGTGGARAGSIKSPVFVGGGRVFGPRPRDYSFKLNKKVKALARQSILASKAQEQKITILEAFSMDKPSTKGYLELLRALQLEGKRSLLIVSEVDKNLYLSSRNVQRATVMTVEMVNTYALTLADTIIIGENSIEALTHSLTR